MNPHFFTAPFSWLSFGSRFRVLVAASPPFLEDDILVSHPSPLGNAYKVSKSPVIPLISGEWIVSHVWHEILRLSSHLFWLGFFTHGRFRPLRMTIREGGRTHRLAVSLFFRRWYSRIAAFPSRGRCPKGADRVTMA